MVIATHNARLRLSAGQTGLSSCTTAASRRRARRSRAFATRPSCSGPVWCRQEILTISRALQQKKLLPDGSFPKTVESLCSMLLLLTNIPFRASFFFLALVIFGHYSYNNRYKEAHPKTNQAGGMDR